VHTVPYWCKPVCLNLVDLTISKTCSDILDLFVVYGGMPRNVSVLQCVTCNTK